MATLALVALGMGGCSPEKSTSGQAQAAEGQKDFIRLEPGSAHFDFLKIEMAQETDAASVVGLTGRVTFDEEHSQRASSPIDGRVTTLLVKPGDHVKPGQPLVELNSPNVGQIQAEGVKAQQDLSVSQKGVDRVHKLLEDGAVSTKEVAQAEADFHKAKAEAARASAQLRSLGISASEPAVRVAVRAQVAGTVVERNVLVGQEVRADSAQPLMTITNLDTVWVLADVYEQDLGLVQMGAGVQVRVPAYPGESFAGSVGHIGDVVDATTRTVKVRCVVPNLMGKLKPEMFAKIELSSGAGHKVLVIPSKAVLRDGEKSKVVVAQEGNTFRARDVEVGPEVDGRVRVLGGLKPGEKIVTEGALFLKHEIESL